MKLAQYSLKVAKSFPLYHYRRGEPTRFKESIADGTKIHTIRNAGLWSARAHQINKGKAFLQLEQWQGKPYRSSPEAICSLNKVGVQLITPQLVGSIDLDVLAMNDGLSMLDLCRWFKAHSDEDLRKMLIGKVIIHFTSFLYP